MRKVGEAQAKADEEMITELEDSTELSEGKKVDYLYTEADGIFIRGTEKKKSHEVSHAILYEGRDRNGKCVSLCNPIAIMTTCPTANFWNEVQALTAHHYSLEKAQVVTKSVGGTGYKTEKIQESFSQSEYQVINQSTLIMCFKD